MSRSSPKECGGWGTNCPQPPADVVFDGGKLGGATIGIEGHIVPQRSDLQLSVWKTCEDYSRVKITQLGYAFGMEQQNGDWHECNGAASAALIDNTRSDETG